MKLPLLIILLLALTAKADVLTDYFEFLSDYFGEDFTASEPRTSMGDVFGGLRRQRISGWSKGDEATIARVRAAQALFPQWNSTSSSASMDPGVSSGANTQAAVTIGLFGVEGAGHHPLHALLQKRGAGHEYLRFPGASFPTNANWRDISEQHPLEASIKARPMKDIIHPMGSSFMSVDFYILLVRAPGACAASALRRFGPRLEVYLDLDDVPGSKQKLERVLTVQQQSQFENMLLLANFASALPWDRTFVLPLELLIHHTDVAVGALVEALGHLLRSPDIILRDAHEAIDGSKLHNTKEYMYSKHPRGHALKPQKEQQRRLKPYRPTPARDLIHSSALFAFEQFYVGYRGLWPLFAPTRAYLEANNMLHRPKNTTIPEWWPPGF